MQQDVNDQLAILKIVVKNICDKLLKKNRYITKKVKVFLSEVIHLHYN